MRNSAVVVIAALVLAAATFVVGPQLGSTGLIGFHPGLLHGDASTGESVMTVESGGTSYGFRNSVAWTDATGSLHDSGWPDCLPKTSEVKDLAFRGGWVWIGDNGGATVLWVDCEGR
jgi:hypothetical protein